MSLLKGSVTIRIQTHFGPNWPGQRCLAKTRRGTKCQRAAFKHNGRCAMHCGLSTGARTPEGHSASQRLILSTGVRLRISWKPSAMLQWVGSRVMDELRRLEKQILDAGLMPDD